MEDVKQKIFCPHRSGVITSPQRVSINPLNLKQEIVEILQVIQSGECLLEAGYKCGLSEAGKCLTKAEFELIRKKEAMKI